MLESTYLQLTQDPKHAKAGQFLARLARTAVPIEHLVTNDWDNCPRAEVYLSVPYPHHAVKSYRRFSDRDFRNAIQWYLKAQALNK